MLFYTRADLDEKEQEQNAADQLSKEMEALKLKSSSDSTTKTEDDHPDGQTLSSCKNEKDLEEKKITAAEVIMKEEDDGVKTNGEGGGKVALKKLGSKTPSKIPLPIEKSIQKQNVRFLHHRNQYSPEFFQVSPKKQKISPWVSFFPSIISLILPLVYAEDHKLQHKPDHSSLCLIQSR